MLFFFIINIFVILFIQIQETQTEVAVEPTLSRDIGSSGPKKAPTQKKQKYGDWITVECFNHILYMQVTSLIKLGASPKLKVYF